MAERGRGRGNIVVWGAYSGVERSDSGRGPLCATGWREGEGERREVLCRVTRGDPSAPFATLGVVGA